MESYLFILLPCLGLALLGIKALTPAGIELWAGRKLPPHVSIILGVCAIVIAAGVAVYVFVFLFVAR